MRRRIWLGALATFFGATCGALGEVQPDARTADLPDSWLVVFNWNNRDSVDWALWYREQRSIPYGNLLGVRASTDEHVPDLATVQTQIMNPIRNRLAADPALAQRIMGIILGYGLPGHYETPPINPTVGGFSVADALQDLHDDQNPPGPYEYQGGQRGANMDCPYVFGRVLPTNGRLTKATMSADRHMVARIDAPSLALAQELTTRAKAISNPSRYISDEFIYYDYYDSDFPSTNHEWTWLRWAVQSTYLPDAPWMPFNVDTGDETPKAAFRFGIYKVFGWCVDDLTCSDPGTRVLAFDLNSYGALTVRSTTAYGGCFAPNALEAGYAAAIGATAEPQCCQSPAPEVILAALREGWTLGEAYYLANPTNDYMWALVGDPFLTLPHWFYGMDPDPEPIGTDFTEEVVVYHLGQTP